MSYGERDCLIFAIWKIGETEPHPRRLSQRERGVPRSHAVRGNVLVSDALRALRSLHTVEIKVAFWILTPEPSFPSRRGGLAHPLSERIVSGRPRSPLRVVWTGVRRSNPWPLNLLR